MAYNLHSLFIATNAPGRSAFNRMERRIASLSNELSGAICSRNQFGFHLDSQNRTIDDALQLINFQDTGEVSVRYIPKFSARWLLMAILLWLNKSGRIIPRSALQQSNWSPGAVRISISKIVNTFLKLLILRICIAVSHFQLIFQNNQWSVPSTNSIGHLKQIWFYNSQSFIIFLKYSRLLL